jgi:EAL and modified HD-GYP domain-containing signal transduction protein
MVEVFVARQPIFDNSQEIFAYELITSGERNSSGELVASSKPSTLILNTFLEIGLNRIVGKQLAWITLDREFILNKEKIPFHRRQFVLNIDPNMKLDEAAVSAISDLITLGYYVAFTLQPGCDYSPLMDMAHIMKLDVARFTVPDMVEIIKKAKRRSMRVCAVNVNSHDTFSKCKTLGFDFFAGQFIAQPTNITGKRLPTRRLAILELLALLYDPEVEVRDLEALVSQDVALGHKLLRMVNSAYYGMSNEVDSFHHALVMLGFNQLRSWLSLLLLSQLNDKPGSLMELALMRARMCELLAGLRGFRNDQGFFIVGLFSLLDVLMDIPMTDVLANLPLTEEINQAILEKRGEKGATLRTVLAYEHSDWAGVNLPGLNIAQIRETYFDSIAWAAEVTRKFLLEEQQDSVGPQKVE